MYELINTNLFRELDPTKRKERKLQNLFRSLKNKKYLSCLFNDGFNLFINNVSPIFPFIRLL